MLAYMAGLDPLCLNSDHRVACLKIGRILCLFSGSFFGQVPALFGFRGPFPIVRQTQLSQKQTLFFSATSARPSKKAERYLKAWLHPQTTLLFYDFLSMTD